MNRLFSLVAVALVLLGGCGRSDSNPEARPLMVFAAASTHEVVLSLASDFQLRTGREVVCNFASSATLARQIRAGAAADIFISADIRWMTALVEEQLVLEDSILPFAVNELVLVSPRDQAVALDWPHCPTEIRYFAIGDPGHVPQGRYAKEAMVSLGWWKTLEPCLITAMDARATLRLVELGQVDMGIVYASDAAVSQKVKVLATLPAKLHRPIHYPMAISHNAAVGTVDLYTWFASDAAKQKLTAAGFHREN